MESSVITLAEQYQRERKWEKAVECLAQYIDENQDCTDNVYASYAKSLRMAGQIEEAKEVLNKSNRLYPESEIILREYLNLYDHTGKWSKKKDLVQSLITLNPDYAEYYFILGRVYAYLNENEHAEKTYKEGLMHKHELPLEDLLTEILQGCTNAPDDFISKYMYASGKNNLGLFIHENNQEKYLTKISRLGIGAKKETIFYEEICSQFPILQEVAPKFINVKVIDDIHYLTIELIDSHENIKTADEVIKVSQKISTVSYSDLIDDYPNGNYLYILKNRANYVTPFFTQIHQKEHNEILFSKLKELARQKEYPENTLHIINHLEALIMDHHLYTFINPEIHYSLLHGDFQPSNIMKKKSDKNLKVIDWPTFKIGPHFIDIARYFQVELTPYTVIKSIYLNNRSLERPLSVIEKIFFLYVFILFHFVVIGKTEFEKRVYEFIIPALIDMEVFISAFIHEDKGFSHFTINQIIDELYIKTTENKNLKKENRKLKNDRNKTQNQLQNVMNSKSWKITAVFRQISKFIQRMQK